MKRKMEVSMERRAKVSGESYSMRPWLCLLPHVTGTVTFRLLQMLIHTMSSKLPDGGAQLRAQKQAILNRMAVMRRPVPEVDLTNTTTSVPAVSGPTVVTKIMFINIFISGLEHVPLYL